MQPINTNLISTERPVTGADLDAVRQLFGLPVADAIWLFGLSPNKWSEMVKHANDPLKDPTLALLVRFLDQHPEISIVPKWPDIRDMYEEFNKSQAWSRDDFSVSFGYERTSTTRWLNAADFRQTAALSRLLYCFQEVMAPMGHLERTKLMDGWRETVRKESEVRGGNVFASGKWPKASNDD